MKNGRVHACTQQHTWGAPCVFHFVLFSAAEMPFDKFSYFIRSNTAIHPIFPPPLKECILLFQSSTGTKQKVYNLPWLPTAYSIRSAPGPGIQTTSLRPSLPSQTSSFKGSISGKLFFLRQTPHTCADPSWKNHSGPSHHILGNVTAPSDPVSATIPFDGASIFP